MTTPETVGAGATSTLTATRPAATIEDSDFPIDGYDSLRASQILTHLDELTLDELDMVREREEQGKNRATVIKRVDSRIDELEAQEDEDGMAEPEPVAPAPTTAFADSGAERSSAAAPIDLPDDDFPIADYDQLSADEIISMLDDLDDDELDMVAEREEQGRNRVEILDYIDDMFEEVGQDGEPVAPSAPPVSTTSGAGGRKAPSKKAAAKVAPIKKLAGKKAAATKVGAAKIGATKVGAPAGKRVVKAAPAAKVGAKKAAVSVAGPAARVGRPPGKKAATTASAASKAPGRKSVAGTAKAPAGPRVAAKKAGIAKVPGSRVVKKR